jgi:hypothetical protein
MTQTIHDFVEWANSTKNYQRGRVVGNNGGLGIFCPKCLRARLKVFPSTFSNHLDSFS